MFIFRVIRWIPQKHLIDKYTKEVPIYWFAMAYSFKDFRSQIGQAATKGSRLSGIILNTFLREAKVGQFNVA